MCACVAGVRVWSRPVCTGVPALFRTVVFGSLVRGAKAWKRVGYRCRWPGVRYRRWPGSHLQSHRRFRRGRQCARSHCAKGRSEGLVDPNFGPVSPEPQYRKAGRSEEHTSELQSLMRISYAVFCLKKKKKNKQQVNDRPTKHM